MMKKLFAVLLALSLLLPAAVSYAETKTPSGIGYQEIGARIDAYIAEREAGLASCAVSVFNAEGTVFTGYYGYADIENGVRADGKTVYEWGSCSKLLVWVSVMQQAERGKIDLNADIRDYLPAGFLTKLQYPEEKITMLNLMAHNAGFQESYYENQEAGPDEAYDTLEDAVRACECYQAYHVGEYTAYSNWGTALAAYIVEWVRGTDYVTYVHENIFATLGMAHTAIDPKQADNECETMPNILIADDEKEIVQLLKNYLETDGVSVLEANDGAQALALFRENDVDLALVDIMMPKVDGYQLIKAIRKREKYVPVIMISAKVALSDRVLGIDLGADDYVTKPFEPLEVAAKVRSQLRRLNATAPSAAEKRLLSVGGVTLDLDACAAKVHSGTVELTKTEFKVLELLMSQPRRVFTKEQIYLSAWYDDGAVDDNTIRVIISRLRDKIGAQHIRTIRGLGYRFEE